jgi:hypothetical protein
MIDADLLRQLGWSEKLINEVTLMSKEINKVVETQRVLEEPVFECSSDSGNSIHFYGTEINSSIDITIQDIGKHQ